MITSTPSPAAASDGGQVGMGHQEAGAAVFQDMAEVLFPEGRADRDRHDTGQQAAQKGDREGEGIRQDYQHPLAGGDPLLLQEQGKAPAFGIKFAIGDRAFPAEIGGFIGMAFQVARQQQNRGVNGAQWQASVLSLLLSP